MSRIKALAALYGVRVSYLVDDESANSGNNQPAPDLSPDALELARAFDVLSPETKETIGNAVRLMKKVILYRDIHEDLAK